MSSKKKYHTLTPKVGTTRKEQRKGMNEKDNNNKHKGDCKCRHARTLAMSPPPPPPPLSPPPPPPPLWLSLWHTQLAVMSGRPTTITAADIITASTAPLACRLPAPHPELATMPPPFSSSPSPTVASASTADDREQQQQRQRFCTRPLHRAQWRRRPPRPVAASRSKHGQTSRSSLSWPRWW